MPAGGARARLKGAAGGRRPQCGARRPRRGQGVSGAGPGRTGAAQSAPTHTDDGDPTAAPLRSQAPAQRPPGSRPAQPAAHPGLPMAPEVGASPRARLPLPWAALLFLAALLPVVSSAGAPGMRSPGLGRPALRASSPLPCPPSVRRSPACRSGDRRPALYWLHVLSLTCASSSLAGRGAEGRLGTRVRAFGASRAGGGPGDTVGGMGTSAQSGFNFAVERPESGDTAV